MSSVVGLFRGAFVCALLGGVAVGVAYTLSPTTVWFGLAMAGLFGWAQKGASPDERRWILGVLLTSLVLRLAVLAGFFLFGGSRESLPVLIGDEWLIKWRSLLLMNIAQGHWLAAPDYVHVAEDYGNTGLMNAFAYWQLWFGPAPYGTHLINVTLWHAAAISLYRMTRRGFGPVAAVGGLVLLLFVPTLFVWSVSALKEPIYFFLTTMAIAGGYLVLRGPGLWRRMAGGVLVVVACAAIWPIRSIALAVVSGGVMLGMTAWLCTRRGWLAVAAATILVGGVVRAQQTPTVEAWVMKQYRMAATTHLGNVQTVGYSYRLLDQRFYMNWTADPVKTLQPDEAGRFTLRALVSFFAEPLPWHAESTAAVVFIVQQVVWYVLAALMFVGIAAGWRRDSALTSMLVGNIIVGGVVVALFNGNVGTFVRFRDSVVTIIVWLSALGGCVAIEWAARRFFGENLDASS